ncbi:MAG TPA: flagellar filament capping protein FliD [Rhodanobacteraceae bacterium]|nr:flagellar filament capping protein FliD [Rhodanobacteraceae bacterium]
MSVTPTDPSISTSSTITALGVGSGLNLNGLLDQIQQNENQALVPLTNKQQSYQTRISAYGTLSSALSAFQDAANALGSASTFQAVKSSVADDAVTASPDNTTPPGDYQINVTQRAQASSVATLGVASNTASLGAGSINFTLANGNTMSVAVSAGSSNIQSIANAINAQNGGVNASVINDGSGSPYRLVLRASSTGTAAAVSNIQFSGDLASSLSLDASTQQAGQNAQFSVNGIAIQSASNQVDDAIQGVTLNLAQAGSATLQVTRDTGAITTAVQGFVDAYNALSKVIGNFTSYDPETRAAGVLLGDSTVRGVQSQLRGVLTSVIGNGGSLKTLTDVGITLQLDGTLQLDTTKLGQIEAGSLPALQQFFAGGAGGQGIAGQVKDAVVRMAGTGGLISGATDGLNASIKSLQQQYSAMQDRISATMANYKQQFSQLDGLIAQMNSTSSYLTQQFDAMSKMLSGGK